MTQANIKKTKIITEVLKVSTDDSSKNQEAINKAAVLIKNNELVAFPTETVYGLGANALNPTAVEKIFKAKGRPADNPLIVHITDIDDISKYTDNIPQNALKLVRKFWPGALTIVVPRNNKIPDIVSAGLDTVALRMPSHPIAIKLINLSGCPIAAPSANSSGNPSPTDAMHVYDDLQGKIPMILDGGACSVGVESTVVSFEDEKVIILRPGGITIEQIKEVVPECILDKSALNPLNDEDIVRSPGMKYKHYAPNAQVIIIKGEPKDIKEAIKKIISATDSKKIGILATEANAKIYNKHNDRVLSLGEIDKPNIIATNLFSRLRDFNSMNVDIIYAEAIPLKDEGLAVMNRMARAAGFRYINAKDILKDGYNI